MAKQRIIQNYYHVTRTKDGLDIKQITKSNREFKVPEDMFEPYLGLQVGESVTTNIIIHPDENPVGYYAIYRF